MQKVSYFFFTEKVGGSINQSNPKILCFFFPRSGKKKIQGCIFFFPEKVHEAFIQDLVGFSFFFLKVGCVFFFHIFVCFFCVFFFPVKVHMPFIHSISKLYFFFSSLEKKNTAFSFIQSILPQNVKKMNFYRKKKYDTFTGVKYVRFNLLYNN